MADQNDPGRARRLVLLRQVEEELSELFAHANQEFIERALNGATEEQLFALSARIHAQLDARHPPLVLRLGS